MALSKFSKSLVAAFAAIAVMAAPLGAANANEAKVTESTEVSLQDKHVSLKSACDASHGKAVFYYDFDEILSVFPTIENLRREGFDVVAMTGSDIENGTVLLCINGKGPAKFTQDDVFSAILSSETKRIYTALLGEPDASEENDIIAALN